MERKKLSVFVLKSASVKMCTPCPSTRSLQVHSLRLHRPERTKLWWSSSRTFCGTRFKEYFNSGSTLILGPQLVRISGSLKQITKHLNSWWMCKPAFVFVYNSCVCFLSFFFASFKFISCHGYFPRMSALTDISSYSSFFLQLGLSPCCIVNSLRFKLLFFIYRRFQQNIWT